VAEYDRLGREQFLAKYGFGAARSYFLIVGRRRYDSKAILGAAYGYEHPDQKPLRNTAFSGGEKTVAHRLDQLGFMVVVVNSDGSERPLERVLASRQIASVQREAEVAAADGEFDPLNIEDARQRILA